jgi:osmotically-inducible protein OsmY
MMQETAQHPDSDHDLKRRILEALRSASDVDADHVGVAVSTGTVVLAGEVESVHEKDAVLRAAFCAEGLRAVADELVVKSRPGGYEDVDIVRAAGAALAAVPTIPDGSVRITVHDGRVLLTGSLTSPQQRVAVDHAMRTTPGVTAVLNTIDIEPYSRPVADEAADRIAAALVRRAKETAAGIEVSAEGGLLELAGTVRSRDDVRQALEAACAVAGVTTVRNRLTVRS